MNIAFDHSQDPPSLEALERHISSAAKALLARQHEDGHWCFELEADATIFQPNTCCFGIFAAKSPISNSSV